MANGVVSDPPRASRAILMYNVLRLALFGVCFGIGWLAGIPTFPLLVTALIASGALSWFVLRRQRIAMGMAVEQTVGRGRARVAERPAAEDAYVDAVTTADGTQQHPSSPPGDQPAL